MPIFKPWANILPEAQIAVDHLETNLEFWDRRRNSGFLRRELFEELEKEVKERRSRRKEHKQLEGAGKKPKHKGKETASSSVREVNLTDLLQDFNADTKP